MRIGSLRTELAPLTFVTVVEKYADAVASSGGLDAVFVPLMTAMEWGAIKPPAPLYQTQVVKMPDYEVAQGRPPYAIPGIAIAPGESLDPLSATRRILRESFKAIRQFNQASPIKLTSIGVVVSLRLIKAGESIALLRDAYSLLEP
jgi:hypothetical protein